MDNVMSNEGVYTPEFVPEDTPAPHFQRPPLRSGKRDRPRDLEAIKRFEMEYGRLEPWNPLLRDKYKRF